MMMIITIYLLENKARRGDGEYGRLYEGAEGQHSRGTHGHSVPALIHWEVKVGGKSMEDVGGAGFAGS